MKILGVIHDPVFVAKPQSATDRFFLKYIKDERDLPFVYLTIQITFTMILCGVLLYMPFVTGWLWWVIAFIYTALNNARFKGPFGLMMHCTSHRPLFKNEYKIWNKYQPWVVGPFFGQTPETYYSHHIGMHHAENNLTDDDSSTMAYQRDSLKDFLRYYFDFLFTGLAGLVSYLNWKNRRKLASRAFIGEMTFFAVCIGLSFVNFAATLIVFILPFVIARIIMMLGNWTQHSFIDAKDPGNPYKNSITCINVKYNHKCWNDGYHISHHERPAMHWTEHPVHFQKTLAKYAANKAVVFDGLDYGRIFLCLMQKRYDVLVKHLVNIDGTFKSDEEAIAFLKERTQRIGTPILQAHSRSEKNLRPATVNA